MGAQSAMSDHDTKILSLLREQRTQGLFTDVKIVSSNAVFWAHACVLAPFSLLVSKTFYSKSHGPEKKWSTQCPCTLTFPSNKTKGSDPKFCEECIQKVIDFIYCGHITVSQGHGEHIQFVCRFLEIENLLPTCESSTVAETSTKNEEFSDRDLQMNDVNDKKSCFPSLSEKRESKSSSGGPVRLNFENILSENNSLISSNESFPKNIGVTDKKNSVNPEKTVSNASMVLDLNIPEEREPDELNKEGDPKQEKSLKKHKLNPSDLLCLFCSFEGTSASELIHHKLSISHEKDTICFICRSDYSSNYELQTHLKEHLEQDFGVNSHQSEKPNLYKCDVCGKEYSWRQNFQRHLSSHSIPNKKCTSCDFVTNTDYALKYHVKKMHSDFCFSCYHEDCPFKTKRKGNLKNHILSVHKKTKLCCQNCDKTFSQKKNLQRHLNLYHNTATTIHQCSLCTYVTHRADNLQKHKLSMHKVKGLELHEDNALEKPPSPVTLNVISSQNRNDQTFSQKPLDVNFCLSASIAESPSFTPVVSVTCSDFTVNNPTFSGAQLNLSYSQNGPNFSLMSTESSQNKPLPQMISLPDIDCNNTGTLSFNETAGTVTCHNLNSDSTGALILNETTGELTYIKLVPQSPAVLDYPNFPRADYSIPCTNYPLASESVILNESTGELDSINQQELLEFDRALGRCEEDAILFDPADEEEEENELLDFDPSELLNECNSNPEIPVLNEWTGEINLLPNNFLGGPFLDEQTGQLSVFDLFDNDAIFDCLEEPPLPNVILNENTGEILRNNKTESGTDLRPNETLAEGGDCAVFCDELRLDNDCEYSLNEATGQLSIEWPDVSEDSNFSFLLNELTGELSVKGISG